MSPVVEALRAREGVDVTVCVTGQHRDMLDQVLERFAIVPDFDLDIMEEGQSLFHIAQGILGAFEDVLTRVSPDLVLVHGDTSTTFFAALSAFYRSIPVGHVEAGLRTWDLQAPFPEEFNRQATDIIAALHFAPTEHARRNLLSEGKNDDSIFVTGNTVIDALAQTVREEWSHPILDALSGAPFILLTTHRRENIGAPMAGVFRAIRRILDAHPDIHVVFPAHRSPQVLEAIAEHLGTHPRLIVTEPLEPLGFHNLMARSHLVLTDSGGLQEEAPSFDIPVLVLRDVTERPEGVEAGTLRVVGTDEERIVAEVDRLLGDPVAYRTMADAMNPYGDGHASERIADTVIGFLRPDEPIE